MAVLRCAHTEGGRSFRLAVTRVQGYVVTCEGVSTNSAPSDGFTDMPIAKWDRPDDYAAQSDIVKHALATGQHSLNELLRRMRNSGQTSLYLAGSRLDNDYCFGSEDIGVLLSVLPEDARKAAEPGYHPGSTEVYVPFQGNLLMEFLEGAEVVDKAVGEHGVLVVPSAQCHRVRRDESRQAASLIIKTNLRHKPAVIRCGQCVYFPDKSACPLFRNWNAEAKPD